MQFTPDDYRRFAFGIDHADFDADGAWLPQRISKAMTPIYDHAEGQVIRRNCTAGIGLRFATDATSVELSWRTSHPARARYRGALVVDGGEPQPVGSTDMDGPWSGVIFTADTAAMRTVELHLPHTCRAEITRIAFNDGASIEPAPRHDVRWLAYGDSITQGMDGTLPTSIVIGRCARAMNAHALNLGIGGAVCDPRLAETIPDFDFDFASIAYGTNDFNKNITSAEFAENTRCLITALTARKPGAPILLLTPLPWVGRENQPNEAGEVFGDYRRALTPVAEAFDHVILIEGPTLVAEDIALLPDSVHPNDDGFAAYAENLLPHLRSIP